MRRIQRVPIFKLHSNSLYVRLKANNPPLPAAAKDPRPFPRWWWQQHYGLGRPEQWRMVRALDLVKDLCLDLQAMRTTLLSNFHKKNVKATHNRMFVAVLMYRREKNMNAPGWFGHVWPPIIICFEAATLSSSRRMINLSPIDFGDIILHFKSGPFPRPCQCHQPLARQKRKISSAASGVWLPKHVGSRMG